MLYVQAPLSLDQAFNHMSHIDHSFTQPTWANGELFGYPLTVVHTWCSSSENKTVLFRQSDIL